MNGVGIEVVNAAEIAAHADGPVDGRASNTQHLLDFIHQLDGIANITIELVDEGHDGRITQTADIHQLDGAVLDALGTIDHHKRRIDRRQRPVSVL